MTVDEILASGKYTDRRGREWRYFTSFGYAGDAWCLTDGMFPILAKDMMRLLIERDMHRDECEGLGQCWNHPVAHVVIDHQLGLFDAFSPGSDVWGGEYDSLPAAMDAAYRLAVTDE